MRKNFKKNFKKKFMIRKKLIFQIDFFQIFLFFFAKVRHEYQISKSQECTNTIFMAKKSVLCAIIGILLCTFCLCGPCRAVSIELVCKFQFWINAIGGNFANTHMTLNWSIALKELIMQEMQWHQFNHLFMLKKL